MTEKYIPYSVDGRSYKIPESKSAEFEKTYPSATIRMSVDDRTYNIPLEQKNEFMKTYSNATYAFDEPSVSDAEEISAPVSVDDEPEMTRKERRQALRNAMDEDDRTSFGETLGKSFGAAGTRFAKQALDLGRMAWNSSVIGGAINMLTGNSYDEKLQDEDNLMTQWSTKLGETADRLSLEADPTGGKEGYLDLIKQGRLGTVLQKAVGSGIESLPMMVAAMNPYAAAFYGAAMAESEYADETRENPDIPAWKRRANAVGQAALELSIERLGGPLKPKGKLTKEVLEELLGEAAKEGSETIAKRIFKAIGGVLKEGGEEGLEELGTSFGNDILGTALDAIDGDSDYGIKAQWEQLKAENPNADAWEFAKMKGEEYMDSFIGGAVSGMEISSAAKGINKGVSLMRGETRTAVQAARENGAALDYADMYDTDALVSESATALEGALVDKDGNPIVDRAFIDNISADEAYALAGREDFSNEQRKAFFDYAVAKAQSDGLNEKLDNRLNEQINAVRGRIDEATDNNGQVIVGTLDGKAVYVKGGFVTEKGTVAVGEGGVNGPVVVIDSVTGEKTTVSSDQIQRAASHDANELFGGMESAFRDREAEQRNTARNTVSPRAKLDTVMGLQNRKMLVDLGNGLIEVEVMKVDPKTGEVMIKGKKGDLGGQAITKLGTDVFYDSLYRDENGEFAFVDEIDTPTEPEDVPTDIPVAPETTAEEGPAAETPAEVTEMPDYRGETYTILQNGVPVEAEVVSQDEASDTVVYRIMGENGQPMLLSSTIGEFGRAIKAAANPAPVAPEVETEPEAETAPETPADVEPEAPAAPIEPEAIDWDALFDSDPEAYFAELQNQFGEEALDILNEEIEAAQNELDALAKAKTKNQNERLENRNKKKALQNRIDALNGMVARLAPPAAPASPEVTPEVPTAPVAPTVPQGVENVPDFSIDKASEARKRGFRMTNGQRVDRRGETSGVYGKDIEVTFTSESKGKRGGKVKVIEAGSLVPSHIGGVENVYHFLPEAQPKKRTDAASTVSATLIAQNMDSAKMTNVSSSAYEGAPSVNKRGEAIQGNNRAAAIIEMYQAYPEKAAEYKQYLIDHSAEFGIDAATVAAMQNPVLVRELDVDDTDAIALGQHTMQDMESGGSQMIDSGRAIAGLSNKGLLEEFIARLLAEENEEASDMNLNDLITRNGNDAIKMLYHNGIINQTQYQSALGPNGKVTADARAALRGIIEQQLFANGIDNLSVMFEVLPDKAKKAIMQTIARDLKNPEDSKVTPYIQEAIEIYYQLNKLPDFVSAKTDAEIDSAIESFKAQTSLDQDGVPAEKYTNFAFVLARNFKAKTQKQQRELLNYLYDTIEGTADIFGESEGKPLGEAVAEVYNTNLNKAKDETDEEGGDSVLEGGTGEGPEGRQGSTGGVGIRPTTGEGGQGAGNGGTNTTFGGGVGSEGEVGPKEPKTVDNPVAEAQKKEKSLAIQLKRIGIPHEQKQDMAFNAGKAVADFFATREEYEAYAENATDFGEYNADFERGVDASFANRQQNTGETQGNSVPLENEPKGEDNGKANEPETEDTEGRVDRIGSEPSNDEGSEESGTPSEEVGGSEADNTEQVEDKYPARTGDVTPQILKETFGMRDVASDINTYNLNSIYDFMMEMAKILGISPKSIGHGATLGAENYNSPHTHIRAQYSYRQAFDGTVKNPVLRFRNAALSSIAHEWWHSLDTALAYYETGKTHHTATNSNDSNFTGRAETLKAVKDVLKAINKSGHKDRLNIELANNPSYLKYSKQKDEMSARAFEEYILMKFAEAGIEVDTHTAFFSNRPNAEEMKVIAPAFDKLFEVLQEKEGKTPGTSVLFQIGQEVDEKIDENNTSEVARKLANEAIDMMFEQAGREVVFVTDEQAEQMRRLAGADAEFMIDSDKPVFVSNAAVAVMGIKQEKATPAQWLAMIEKNGGLKAGEDKWMGLSDWLKASDKKTLTKEEVLDYIAEHMIQIEEVHYAQDTNVRAEIADAEIQMLEKFQPEFDEYVDESEEATGSIFMADHYQYAYNKMLDIYGDDFGLAFGHEDGMLEINDTEAASAVSGVPIPDIREIDPTRENYTTEGLTKKREIAIIVPTIESWGTEDEIHFGDAGEGRAVAWVRFGETYINEEADAAYEQARAEEEEFKSQMEQKYGSLANGMRSTLTEEEYAHYMNLVNRTLQLNESRKTAKEKRVLVIDEIQSKRHQEGREKGYRTSREDVAKATEAFQSFNRAMKEKYGENVFPSKWSEEDQAEFDRLRDEHARVSKSYDKGIPDAPFEKNWHELAMKRMLRYAAEEGYDAIAWTKGEQQADRYGIGTVVEKIILPGGWIENNSDKLNGEKVRPIYVVSKNMYDFSLSVNEEGVVVDGSYTGQNLSDVVGKEMAVKLMTAEPGTSLEGDELRIGGEGMKGFYDKMLPAFMNKYGKKWGIKVADITLPNVEEAGRVMHSVPVTDAMKESVMEGQVMFMKRPNGKVFGWTDGKKIYLTKDGLNPNTKIHEYTHLWAQAMMQKNPKGWQSVKDLLRGTPVWNEVLNDPNYSNIHADEDLVASEVLSRLSGRDGSAKLERIAQQMVDEAKGSMRKLEARGLIQRIKDALNEFWNWVGTELFSIEKFESVEQVTYRVLWDLMNATDLGSLEEGQTEFSIIPEGELKEKLKKEIEDGEYITLYRAVRKINGKYYSPKMSKLGGVGQEIVMGELEQSDERPDLAYPVTMADGTVKYKVNLDGSDPAGTGLKSRTTNKVDYNPYIHASDSMMNDQFTAAFAMPEMTVIEVRVPKSELTSGYHAEKAADHVGLTPWKSGTVDLKLPKDEQRNVYLSRYDMPVREVPTEEIADHIAAKLLRNGLSMPYNLVTPQVAEALIRRGVDVSEKPSGNVPAGQNEKFKELKERVLNDMKDNDSPITPEMDADYLAAVERGDMETAKRMVLEAAKLAMPNTKVVDENGNPRVVYHGTNAKFTTFVRTTGKRWIFGAPFEVTSEGFFFAPNKEEAEQYGKKYIIPVFLNITNPLDTTDDYGVERYQEVTGEKFYPEMGGIDRLWEMMDEAGIADVVKKAGYDGVIFAESLNEYGEVKEMSWAALDSSQIKSADPVTYDDNGNIIPLSERFNPEKSDIRYRFVGEQGAMRIDAATKSTWMLDGLAQARRMEGKFNAKEIKRATGWERGTDGKWRYEEPDNLSIKEDKAKELYDAFVHNREIELGVRPKSEGYKIDVFRLEDVLDAPELYRAYPEFKDMRIRPKMLGGANGVYRGNVIDIHGALFKPSYKGELEDVLLHELQHAIQVKEGFIEGTDASNGWDNYINNAGEVEARNVVARKNMSYAERKLRLASETEDVAREDQIIITNGLLSTDPAYLKSDTQNSAVDYLAGEPRLRAIENAVNEEASKLGVKVTYKTREQMPNGHQNDKGYYDPKTGEVVVCTENATSIADAIQTILHEAVAHKGLRQLMGDKFNEFINRVYESLDAETKAKVDALAESQHNGNKAVAMEEYMATLAESTDFKKDTLWDKIKSIFEDIINAILGRNDIKIGDNELRYILRASYNNMVNPRGMETMRGWAQDQMMREEYKINESTPNILSRTGIDPSATAREAAKSVYDKVVNDTWQEMQRQFQDAYQPVRIAIDAIQQETGNIPIEDYENYLLIQNQSSSRSRVEIDEFAERYYSPIVEQVNNIINKIMEDRGWKVNDADRRAEVYGELRQYLIAKHGLERNEYYQTHKMRNLTAAEKRKEKAIAKQAYDTEVANINADTTLTDAERELQLRDAKDAYDAAILEINTREVPDIRDYSGLTSLFGLDPKKFRQAEAEARNLVDNAENMFGPELDILWERINKATDKTLRHSYESGIISRQQYNDIKDMFEFYIPLRGFEDITAEEIYSYARFEGNRFSPAVQTAKGRTSVANDPLAYIMSMAESEITQGNKNRAKQALYNYLLNRTQTDADGNQIQNSLMQVESVWYVKSVDASGNTVMTMAAPDHASGEAYEEFEARMEALAATGDAIKSKKGKIDIGMRFQKPANMGAHYVHLKVNGVDKAIYINGDPKAADAINGTYKKERNELSEAMGKWNRFLSSMFTNYSLEFTVRNYFRDMLYSHINIGVKESDPAYRKKFRQNWRHNNFRSMVKMLKAFRAGEFEGRALTEDEAAFVEFMKNGGQTGYVVLNKVETHRAELEKAIERMQKGLAKGGVKDSTVFKYTLGGIELLNEASELVTRFAAFKTSRDMGRSVVQSISDAKEVTVNFNTKGAQDGKGFMGMIAHYFGWSKYFFNASMQGVQNLKAMANANKLKFGGVVGGIVATGFLMPIITGAIAQLLGGDEEEYWNIPEYDRQNNFCIPVGNGKYAKIPLPVGFREVYAIGDMVSAMMFDKKFTKDVKSVGTDIANKIASIVLPINPLEGTANGLSIWHTLAYTAAPSSAQLLIQNLTNTDWKGAPLQKEYTYNENDPQWMKAFAGNPDWMKLLSKWCNEHINADGDYKGWDWSPEKLDNTLSNLFGGVYTLIKKTGKSISMIWNEENRNMQNAPVAGVFIGSGIDSDDRFVTDAYYEMMDYYDSQVGYIKRRAARFGYDLDEVFNKEKGKHHPKMNEIYSNKNFDFMQEWYKGNEDLEKLNDKIKNLEKKIAGKENPTQSDLNKLARLKDQFAVERREFVDDMLELD